MRKKQRPFAFCTYSGERFSDGSDGSSEPDKSDKFVDAKEVVAARHSPTHNRDKLTEAEPMNEITNTSTPYEEDEVFCYPSYENCFEQRGTIYNPVSSCVPSSSSHQHLAGSHPLASPNTASVQLSRFTLEDFESLSRLTPDTQQSGDSSDSMTSKAAKDALKKASYKSETQDLPAKDQNVDLISLDFIGHSTRTSYKPLHRYTSEDQEGVCNTVSLSPRVKRGFRQPVFENTVSPLPHIKRGFRQPVFEEVNCENRSLHVSLHVSDEEAGKEEEKEMYSQERERAPRRRERANDLEEQEQDSPKLLGSSRHIYKPNTDWEHFLPTSDEASLSNGDTCTNVKPHENRLPKSFRKLMQASSSQVCDKCGSVFNEDTRRQLFLSERTQKDTLHDTLSESDVPTAPVVNLVNEIVESSAALCVSQRKETKNTVAEEPCFNTSIDLLAADGDVPSTAVAREAVTAMWKSASVLPNTMSAGPSAENPALLMESAAFSTTVPMYGLPPAKHTDFTVQSQIHTNDQRAIPSDLAYGWGPGENLSASTTQGTPRSLETTTTGGIGWDDENEGASSPSITRNGWELDDPFKRGPSSIYAAASSRRDPINSAAPRDRQLAPSREHIRYRYMSA